MTQATYQRTAELPLASLRPFPGNARRGDVPVILESLCRSGQYRSVIVRDHDDQLTILAGNHTTQAIAAHGPGDCGLTVKVGDQEHPCGLCGNREWSPVVRCEIVTCSDDTAARINLVDNRASDEGDYDADALAALLGNLGDDYSGTGYGETDLDDLLAVLDQAAEEEAELLADSPAATSSGGGAGTGEGAGTSSGGIGFTFTYAPKERDETAKLLDVLKSRAYPDADDATVVLYGLRLLHVAMDYASGPDERVVLAELLDAAQAAS